MQQQTCTKFLYVLFNMARLCKLLDKVVTFQHPTTEKQANSDEPYRRMHLLRLCKKGQVAHTPQRASGGSSCCCKFLIIFSCCLLGWVATSKDVVDQKRQHGKTESRHDGVGDCSNASFHKVPKAPCKGSTYAYIRHTLAMDANMTFDALLVWARDVTATPGIVAFCGIC